MARLGIQTIIFGPRSREDFPGVLRDIKAAGYDGAEIGNPTDATPAEEVRARFDAAGLACCGYHTGYDTFRDAAALERIATHLRAVGGRYLMCSGTEGRDRDAYLRSAETFDRAGRVLRENGVTFCYHNHNWEFFDLDGTGQRGIHLLAENTDPDLVKLCIDVYWVACAGEDPVAFIRRYADRAAYFHYKDGTFDAAEQQPLTFTELGRGQVDLRAATEAVRALDPEWIVTEQDRTERDPAESARISAAFARDELGL